jgi:hypothetical protein
MNQTIEEKNSPAAVLRKAGRRLFGRIAPQESKHPGCAFGALST